MKQLTWYPDTILPHTSLWYTLLRVTWLNGLKAGDICKLVGEGLQDRTIEATAYSEWNKNAVKMVAKSLGEPLSGFSDFAAFHQLPIWLYPFISARDLRWCSACLEAGFHSLLMSLRLIEKCPIHGIPLIEKCPGCGGSVSMRTRGLVVQSNICRCGKFWNFNANVIRQPTLDRKDIAPWTPVEKWLVKVRGMCCFLSNAGVHSRQTQMALIDRGCRDLGVELPTCFIRDSEFWSTNDALARWGIYRACSGNLNNIRPAASERISTTSPQVCVYRAMGRHLRRHGLPNPDKWILELVENRNPMTFAMEMEEHRKKRIAFSEMIWTRLLEPHAYIRRWPTRAAPNYFADQHRTPLELFFSERLSGRGEKASSHVNQWLNYHTMAMRSLLAWGDAVRQTQNSINKSWADWSTNIDSLSSRIAWFSLPKENGCQLVGYLCDINIASLDFPLSKQLKLPDRYLAKKYFPSGKCLEWDLLRGWSASRGIQPKSGDGAKLVRLLHAGVKTKCLIYKNKGRFVARLEDGSIQTTGDSPRDALNLLRRAVIQYCCVYGAKHFELPTKPSPQKKEPPPEGWIASHAINSIDPRIGPIRFWGVCSLDLEMARRRFLLDAQQWYQKHPDLFHKRPYDRPECDI